MTSVAGDPQRMLLIFSLGPGFRQDERKIWGQPGHRRECSKQTQRLEAGDPVAADDQMVVDGDAQGAAGLDDLAGDLDVRGRRGGVAGRVVVHLMCPAPLCGRSRAFSSLPPSLRRAVGT